MSLATSSPTYRSHRTELLLASAAINVLSLALPIAVLQVYDRIIPNEALATLSVIIVSLGAILILDSMLNLARSYVSIWSATRLQHLLSCSLLDRLMRADLRVFESTPPGVHLQRLRAMDSIKGFYGGQGLLLLVDLPFACTFILLIGLIAGPLLLAPVVVLLLLGIFAIHSGRRLSEALTYRVAADDRRYNFMIEILRGIHTIKALGMEPLIVRRYERLQMASADANHLVGETSAAARNFGLTFSQVTSILVAAYGSTMVMNGSLTVGSLAACTLLAGRAAQPMLRALGIWTQFQNVRFGKKQIDTVWSMPQEPHGSLRPSQKVSGQIALVDVDFTYRDDLPPLLNGLSLDIEDGETIGISGNNGSGKSTLLGLMTGVLAPTKGEVLFNGVSLKDLDPAAFRRHICYLPQRAALFEGTILENLTMFRGDRYATKAMQFADRLRLHSVIAQMPNGYDTKVDNGQSTRIPGGVQQRIALVRALTLAEDIRLLLFDEGYSHLDRESNQALIEVLQELRTNCTTVIVSHRPSYLSLADRSFVLRSGLLVPASGGAREHLDRIRKEFAG